MDRNVAPKNGRGVLNLFLFKKKLHRYLMQTVITEFKQINSSETEKIRTTFQSIASFRQDLGYRKSIMLWRLQKHWKHQHLIGMPEHAEHFVKACEDVLFTDKYDAAMLSFCKSVKGSAKDMLCGHTAIEGIKQLLTPTDVKTDEKNYDDDKKDASEEFQDNDDDSKKVPAPPSTSSKTHSGQPKSDDNQGSYLGCTVLGEKIFSKGLPIDVATLLKTHREDLKE